MYAISDKEDLTVFRLCEESEHHFCLQYPYIYTNAVQKVYNTELFPVVDAVERLVGWDGG